jgi:AraC-like DNA-binding protein
VSVATLRRRLEEEGTTFTGLVDEVRRDLAERHLSDPHRTISEVAFMLGFAHAPAFHKAFRRWTGATPSERRARLWT